jgi:dTDP-4-dehydrorhamnose reductase
MLNRDQSMKILLTGAQGQVGQAIVQANQQLSMHEIISCNRHLLDITDSTQVRKVLEQHKPDVVINAAAYTAVDKAESERELAFAVNAIGPKNLARACEASHIPLLHLSTDYIFDGQKVSSYREDDPAAPLGVYGKSKWQGEQAVREYCEKHVILRVSWVFGEHGHNFVKTMLRLMQEREELKVVNDQHGCPTYADDIAKQLLAICQDPKQWGTFHYCGAPVTTWYSFAQAIREEASKITALRVRTIHPISTSEYPTPAQRPKHSVLNCDKLYTIYSIQQPQWRNGLVKMLQQALSCQNG